MCCYSWISYRAVWIWYSLLKGKDPWWHQKALWLAYKSAVLLALVASFQLFNTEQDSDVGFSFVSIFTLEIWWKFKRTWLLSLEVRSFHNFKCFVNFKRQTMHLAGVIMVKPFAERKSRRSKQWTVLTRTRTTLCQTSVFWPPGKALT